MPARRIEESLRNSSGIIVCMTSLLTRRQLADMGQLFKLVVVRILAVPPAMVITLAVLLGLLATLAGLPGGELAWGFMLETAAPVAVLQAKMLLAVGAICALCLIVNHYRIEVLVHCVADKLQGRMSRLNSAWYELVWAVPLRLHLTGFDRVVL